MVYHGNVLYVLYLQLSRFSQHTLLSNICMPSLFVNTELNKCFYLFAISEQAKYPPIESATLVVRPLIS